MLHFTYPISLPSGFKVIPSEINLDGVRLIISHLNKINCQILVHTVGTSVFNFNTTMRINMVVVKKDFRKSSIFFS